MGNIDKGLQLFRGKPMVAHALERFGPQVDELLISANRNTAEYEKFGGVIADADENFAGPLAGLLAGMQSAAHSLIATAPCDSPFLPDDLVSRLYAALEEAKCDIAVAQTQDQSHPVFCLAETHLAPHLQKFLQSGQRKFEKWYENLKVVHVSFDDEADAFANINTLDDLHALDKAQQHSSKQPQ